MKHIVLILLLFFLNVSVFAYNNPTPNNTWQFRVFLDDKEIGYHDFQLSKQNGMSILQTQAEFDVKFLFINAFSYRHKNIEHWENDCLNSINSQTIQNKQQFNVTGKSDKGQFLITNNQQEQKLNECVRSFAYWNPKLINSKKLLNSQTGDYEDVNLQFVGEDIITLNESEIRTRHYQLKTNTGIISLWYEWDSLYWVALEAPAKGNRKIRYLSKIPLEPTIAKQ